LNGHDAQSCDIAFFTPATADNSNSNVDPILTAPANGNLTALTNNACTGGAGAYTDTAAITYTPNSNYSGTDTFTYYVADAGGLDSGESTVSITVKIVVSKLAFTTTPVSGLVGQCLGPISVQTQDAGATPANVAAATVVNLSSNSAGPGQFF